MTTMITPRQLTHRDLRLLDAIANGRVTCSNHAEPDFYVDDLAWCDHFSARLLLRDGLIELPADEHAELVLVQLTSAGEARLATEAS